MNTRYIITLAAAALAYAALTNANATGDHKPKPAPAHPPVAAPAPPAPTVIAVPGSPVTTAAELTASQIAAMRQQQAQQQAQQAQAGANATGGQGGSGGSADAAGTGGNSSLTDQSQTTTNAKAWGLSLGLPQPIQLAAMAGVGCPTPNISQSSSYWLWGAHASGNSGTNTDACVLMAGYAHYLSICQFGSATVLLGKIMSARMPGGFDAPPSAAMVNLSPKECADLRSPPVAVVPVAVTPVPVAKAPSERINLSGDALFPWDSAVIKVDAQAQLNTLAARIIGERSSVVIVGHTCSQGSDSYNLALSQRRADAVKAHMMLQGVDGRDIIAIGKGETQPIASNSTLAGQALNRRVELQITVQQPSQRLQAVLSPR